MGETTRKKIARTVSTLTGAKHESVKIKQASLLSSETRRM